MIFPQEGKKQTPLLLSSFSSSLLRRAKEGSIGGVRRSSDVCDVKMLEGGKDDEDVENQLVI